MATDIERLILIGHSEKISGEEFNRKFLYSLPTNPRVLSLGFYELLALIKGLALLELDQDKYTFGSTTSIGKLLKIIKAIKIDDGQLVTDLIEWLFSHRKNSYIPFGIHIPLEVKSILDYEDYENNRELHRIQMAALDQERSKTAKDKRIANIEDHKNTAETKNLERTQIINRLKRLTIKSRIKYIIESDQQINYFPEEFAEISGLDFEKIPKELLSGLAVKLAHAKSNSAWRRLYPVVKAILN